MEILTGCETENKYIIFGCDIDGEKHRIKLFRAKEKSSWFSRIFFP